MRLDLMELTGKESNEIPGFLERLLAALPRMYEHHCGKGYRGGFVERLQEGTWFGHIVEHVCLELTDWAGISVNRGKTVEAGPEGIFDVAVEFRSEPAIRRLLEISVEYVESLVAGRTRWMSESRRSRTLWLGTNWGRAPVHNMKVDVLSRGDRFEIEKRVAVRQ